MRRIVVMVAVLSLLGSACTGSDGTDNAGRDDVVDLSGVALASALRPFGACEEFLDHVRTEAGERVGAYGFADGGGFGPMPVDVLEMDAMADDSDSAASVAGAPAAPAMAEEAGSIDGSANDRRFSDTNTVEADVAEPDLVKTDGDRILTIAQQELRYVDITGDQPAQLGRLDLGEGWGHELFLSGDRAVLLSRTDAPYVTDLDDVGGRRIMPDSWGPITTVRTIDLSNPRSLRIESTLSVEGDYLSARAIGNTARIVVSYRPTAFPFVYPSGPGSEEFAEEANRRIVAESTVDQWLPTYELTETGGTKSSGRLLGCDRMHRPGRFSGFGTLAVLTVDLNGQLTPGDGVGVLADGRQIYASTENLYVATNEWEVENGRNQDERPDETYTTALHKFSIAATAPAEYLASGSVRGHLMNDFSMSEHDGNLRIATTDGSPWGGFGTGGDRSESFVHVLSQQDRELQTIGSVGGLGKGEQIFSVRFLGEMAYVVTFRQTDPLYTIDLSDPRSPQVVGELKILGYSAYLHPIGEGLLLGVGQDATEEGRTTGTQVSIFDVSDPARPTRVQQFTMEDSSSNVEFDYRAFLYWQPEDLVVLPVNRWSWDPQTGQERSFVGAIGLTVGADGIVERGRIEHERIDSGPCDWEEEWYPSEEMMEDREVTEAEREAMLAERSAAEDAEDADAEASFAEPDRPTIEPAMPIPPPGDCFNPGWGAEIQRSLIVDDRIYTISESGLAGSAIDDLSRESWLRFG